MRVRERERETVSNIERKSNSGNKRGTLREIETKRESVCVRKDSQRERDRETESERQRNRETERHTEIIFSLPPPQPQISG